MVGLIVDLVAYLLCILLFEGLLGFSLTGFGFVCICVYLHMV